MSLETLLEAAQFLESHGKGVEINDALDDGSRSVSDAGTSLEESLDSFSETTSFKQPKIKPKSGKMSPIIVSPSDSFFMRAGTREVHNKLEKNRRAHLKECFDFLKKNIPSLEDKRTSNLGILRSSLRYIQNLKRKEREFELEMQKFAREKIYLQQRMGELKTELNKMNIEVDMNAWAISQDQDNDTNSTSTATERGTPPPSDYDENDDDEEEAERLVMETNPSPLPKKNKRMFKDFPNHISKPIQAQLSHLKQITPNLNGVVRSPISFPGNTVSSVKKTIPIMLTASGPSTAIPQSAIGSFSQGFGVLPSAPHTQLLTKDSANMSRNVPVTKILHRTLTQRQALMKQAGSSSQVAPLTAAQLRTPPQPRPHTFLTMTTAQVPPTSLKKEVESIVTSVGGKAQPQLTPTTVSMPGSLPLTFPYYMTSLQKIAHPILVTSLMTPALGGATTSSVIGTSAGTSASSVHASTAVAASRSEIKVKQEPTTPAIASIAASHTDTHVTTSAAALHQQQQALQTLFAPNNLLQRPLAWPFLASIPRTSVVMATTSAAQPSLTSAPVAHTSSQLTTIPLASLAQLNQLSQMVSPVTVNSPGLQFPPATLSQAQLNAMLSTQFLKQFQIPFGIPSNFLQPGPVLGQQMMKPVVVVTVPSVVTQSQSVLTANVNLSTEVSTTSSTAV